MNQFFSFDQYKQPFYEEKYKASWEKYQQFSAKIKYEIENKFSTFAINWTNGWTYRCVYVITSLNKFISQISHKSCSFTLTTSFGLHPFMLFFYCDKIMAENKQWPPAVVEGFFCMYNFRNVSFMMSFLVYTGYNRKLWEIVITNKT